MMRTSKKRYVFRGYEFKQFTPSNPEQYYVYRNRKRVAYIRLRYGFLCYHEVLNSKGHLGECNKIAEFEDTLKGCFETEGEKNTWLRYIARLLAERKVGNSGRRY